MKKAYRVQASVQRDERVSEKTGFPKGAPRETRSSLGEQTTLGSDLSYAAY